MEAAFGKITDIKILVMVIIIFFLGCLKPLLPKFQSFLRRLSIICILSGGNTQTNLQIELLPSGILFNGFDFARVDLLIIIIACIALDARGFFSMAKLQWLRSR